MYIYINSDTCCYMLNGRIIQVRKQKNHWFKAHLQLVVALADQGCLSEKLSRTRFFPYEDN